MTPDDLRRRNTLRDPENPRYVGMYRAVVHDNDDPEKLGRLQLVIPGIVDQPYRHWAWPRGRLLGGGAGDALYGDLFLPEVGDRVQVEFEGGDPREPIWGPGWFGRGKLPEQLKTHYPRRRGLVTPSGHSLLFDDSEGNDGDVELGHRDGAKLQLGGNGDALIVTTSGRRIWIKEAGNDIEIEVQSGGTVNVKAPGGTVNLDADMVNVGEGADSEFVRWFEFEPWASGHRHGTAIGPTFEPTEPVPPASKSTRGKVK